MEDNKWESELEQYRPKSSEDEIADKVAKILFYKIASFIIGGLIGFFIVSKIIEFFF